MKRVHSNASPSPTSATRRTHDAAFKRRLVELTLLPGASVARIALDHRLNANILFRWRREHVRALARSVASPSAPMLPVTMIESEDSEQKSTPAMLSLMSERASCALPLSVSSFEIALPRGRLTLKGGIDSELLRLVVELLSQP